MIDTTTKEQIVAALQSYLREYSSDYGFNAIEKLELELPAGLCVVTMILEGRIKNYEATREYEAHQVGYIALYPVKVVLYNENNELVYEEDVPDWLKEITFRKTLS